MLECSGAVSILRSRVVDANNRAAHCGRGLSAAVSVKADPT
jgi:hypothetical protein